MSNFGNNIAQYWETIQRCLFPFLEETLGPLTEKHKQLIAILELVRIEEFITSSSACMGRPPADRRAIVRAFVVKCFYSMPITRALLDRLKSDHYLRRICGWEAASKIPSESTFSRAFAEFAETELPRRAHEALIKNAYQDKIVGQVSRDSTAIEAREKPKAHTDAEPLSNPANAESQAIADNNIIQSTDSIASKNVAVATESNIKQQQTKGRPKKGAIRPAKEKTRIQKQLDMQPSEMIQDLPKDCDRGVKKNSKGYTECWTGYKLHIDTEGNGVPLNAILTSASVHDSQVAIPLAATTAERAISLYDLMDAAYDDNEIKEYCKKLNHVPIIDVNPRGDSALKAALADELKARKALNWKPAEAVRYNGRTVAERSNARMKDEFGGRTLRVKGHAKAFCHLMIGILVLAADQLIRIAI